MEVNGKHMYSADFMKAVGKADDNRIHITIPEARQCLGEYLRREIGNSFKWLPPYDEIVDWLTDNHGLGLLCLGNNGLGKTLICSKAIPAMLGYFMNRVVYSVDACRMASYRKELLYCHILSIDDVGAEPLAVDYGNKAYVFPEVVDAAEKRGKLLLITSNLSSEEIIAKYGIRTFDRLRGICKVVLFKGKSLRNNGGGSANPGVSPRTT